MTVRGACEEDIDGIVALQRSCFPPPFPEELLWRPDQVQRHLHVFPDGQFVAVEDGRVVGSASSCQVGDASWTAHRSWAETVGGPYLENHDPEGSTLYGLDISVHPANRGMGVGRLLYTARFELVRKKGLVRYGTACRLPGYLKWSKCQLGASVESYVQAVIAGREVDRTLTPLLRYGLDCLGVIHGYMEDEESGNSAALLEWKP